MSWLNIKHWAELKDRAWLAACLAVSGTIQLSFISKASIWHDEGYTMGLATQSLSQIISRTARDVHPPLYYLLLHFWLGLFGTSELAARSFSVLAILLIIVISWLLIKRLFGAGSARLAVLLLAIAPFLIRYGQEARMYTWVALFIVLATYLLVVALDRSSRKHLYLYGVVMALALYTHYYSVLFVPLHWLYVWCRGRGLTKARPAKTFSWLSRDWLGTNALIAIMFLPWLPKAYAQFSRVQGGFWISPVDERTLPSTLSSWLNFTDWQASQLSVRLAAVAIVVVSALAWWQNKEARRNLSFLILGAIFAPLAIFGFSLLGRPIYVERYFVFASVFFYLLLAALFYLRPLNLAKVIRPVLLIGLCFVLLNGISQVHRQANHRMRELGQIVNEQFSAGDELVAGELYVYFDFSYYNKTSTPLKLYSPAGITGYGETSLLYDKPELVIEDWAELKPNSGTVWLIGKTGDKDYYRQLPANWRLQARFNAKDSEARKYHLDSRYLATD